MIDFIHTLLSAITTWLLNPQAISISYMIVIALILSYGCIIAVSGIIYLAGCILDLLTSEG